MKAIVFDTFGTLVDWRTSIIRQLKEFGKQRQLEADWAEVTDRWRQAYEPSLQQVRAGARPWVVLDELHRESLARINAEMSLGFTPDDLNKLTLVWHRLEPWPDVIEALTRLHSGYILGPLSNGGYALLVNLARYARLPWDAIFSVELFELYKPDPAIYQGVCRLLRLPPDEVMLVAAHNYDLHAAQQVGLKTAFVPRPTEYGPHQDKDLEPDGQWDFVVQDLGKLADALAALRA
jgi:2-haloacid dehalogenase